MDRLQAMTTFVAVVEAQGFAAAARKLGISQPVVTRAVAELESHLGVKLLTRTTRVVRVTEAGARYAADCRRIAAEVAEADEAAAGAHAAPRGPITVTAPALFGRLFVLPVVGDYLRRYPDVAVSCWFLDRVVQLVEEGVDVAVRIGELPDSTLVATRVGRVRRVLCASPEYLAQHGTPLSPKDLAQHQIVAASGISPSTEWRFADGMQVRVSPRLTTTTNDAAVDAALAGLGITRLLSYQVAQELAQGRLVALLVEHETAPLAVHVVHREQRQGSPRVRAFVDLAVAALRGDAALNA
jgi:DNA-binding transcriptional LysR family regulator